MNRSQIVIGSVVVCSGNEVVTNCDHLVPLVFCQLKHEVIWKAILIAADGLIQDLGFYAVQFGEVAIRSSPSRFESTGFAARFFLWISFCFRFHDSMTELVVTICDNLSNLGCSYLQCNAVLTIDFV